MTSRIDRSKWSAASRRSDASHYDENAEFYENIACRCRRCGRPFLFTAEEQKSSYEERHDFVWRIPRLCPECQVAWIKLKESLKQCQEAWNDGRVQLASDRAFLKQWRSMLREAAAYGRKGSNSSIITMINKLLT